jgi:hypothetical protein
MENFIQQLQQLQINVNVGNSTVSYSYISHMSYNL